MNEPFTACSAEVFVGSLASNEMETTPPEQAGGAVQGYSRADVDRYLAAAAAEQRRLDDAIASARERQQRAEEATAKSGETAELVLNKLAELRRELAARRAEIDHEVEAIVARARDEAAEILRDARARAHGVLEATRGPAAAPGPAVSPTPPPPPTTPIVAAEPAPADAALATLTVDEPPVVEEPEIDLTLENAFWQAPTAAGSNGNGHSGNGHPPANGAKNGSGGDALDTGELRAQTGFATLLRRALPNRPADPAESAEDDAFFDFLRGALEDPEPLGSWGHPEETKP
jgi:hypothetical protein